MGLYREELPPSCPPGDAIEITAATAVYRLIGGQNPCDQDFESHQAKKPNVIYPDPCIARGLSVLKDTATAERFKKLPTMRSKKLITCRVALCGGAGRLKLRNDGHFTWWPFAEFHILSRCEVVG
jgi:hypothetical protein